ncbi:hypothetical protein, partial [Nocardia brevicatena]|uniref:hypothetical protein n=1 Tax=Nocardia brevicatena TaxID=37327 RepID=UPI001FE019F5
MYTEKVPELLLIEAEAITHTPQPPTDRLVLLRTDKGLIQQIHPIQPLRTVITPPITLHRRLHHLRRNPTLPTQPHQTLQAGLGTSDLPVAVSRPGYTEKVRELLLIE